MSTDQTTIDRLRAELAEARAVAARLQTENHELKIKLTDHCIERDRLQIKLDAIQAYARGQKARHVALRAAPEGQDWVHLFDLMEG